MWWKKPTNQQGKELNYSNGIYNTPPDELAFATATININGIETEAMFDSGARFSILPFCLSSLAA